MIEPFFKYIDDYKEQVKKGPVKKAYKGLMEYLMFLRTYLANKYPLFFVSGSIYYGYLDMSYFSFHPESFKDRKLRVGIVMIHEECRFDAWLAGYNKQIQYRYWNLLQRSGWNKYPLVESPEGVDAIIEHVLVENPDFEDLDELTRQIEDRVLAFIGEIDEFLATHPI